LLALSDELAIRRLEHFLRGEVEGNARGLVEKEEEEGEIEQKRRSKRQEGKP